MSQPPIQNWLQWVNAIPDPIVKQAYWDARLGYFPETDDSKLHELLTDFEAALVSRDKDFSDETDLEVIIRLESWFAKRGWPVQKTLALLTILEVRRGNFSLAIQAHEKIDTSRLKPAAEMGRKLSRKMSKARAKRQELESLQIKERQGKWERLAKDYLESHLRASDSEVATYIFRKVEGTPDERAVRTIREYLKKQKDS